MRKRAGRDEWAKRVARWQRSGLPGRAFAEQTGLNAHTLTFWKWRLGREGAGPALAATPARGRGPRPAPSFVEVVTRPAAATDAQCQVTTEWFEVLLAGGLRVRVPRSANRAEVEMVAALVTALAAR